MFWLFLIMAMVANLFGLVAYVARNAGEEPPDVGPPQPSELQQRFKERPEECMFVLLFGLVSTETLCFLSSDEREHLRFRKLGLLTNLIEGAPTLVLNQTTIHNGNVDAPTVPTSGWLILPKRNKHALHRGDLHHGAPHDMAAVPVPPGKHQAFVEIATDDPDYPEVRVPVLVMGPAAAKSAARNAEKKR